MAVLRTQGNSNAYLFFINGSNLVSCARVLWENFCFKLSVQYLVSCAPVLPQLVRVATCNHYIILISCLNTKKLSRCGHWWTLGFINQQQNISRLRLFCTVIYWIFYRKIGSSFFFWLSVILQKKVTGIILSLFSRKNFQF